MKLCRLKIAIVVNDKLTQTNDNKPDILKMEQESVYPNTPPMFATTSIGCTKAVTLISVKASKKKIKFWIVLKRRLRQYASMIRPLATVPSNESRILITMVAYNITIFLFSLKISEKNELHVVNSKIINVLCFSFCIAIFEAFHALRECTACKCTYVVGGQDVLL